MWSPSHAEKSTEPYLQYWNRAQHGPQVLPLEGGTCEVGTSWVLHAGSIKHYGVQGNTPWARCCFGLVSKAESAPFGGSLEERSKKNKSLCPLYFVGSGQQKVPGSPWASQQDLLPLPPTEVIDSWILPLTELAPKMVCLYHNSTIPHKKESVWVPEQ